FIEPAGVPGCSHPGRVLLQGHDVRERRIHRVRSRRVGSTFPGNVLPRGVAHPRYATLNHPPNHLAGCMPRICAAISAAYRSVITAMKSLKRIYLEYLSRCGLGALLPSRSRIRGCLKLRPCSDCCSFTAPRSACNSVSSVL